jgi:hypothetical protein
VAEHDKISFYLMRIMNDLSLRITLSDAGNNIHALCTYIADSSIERLLKAFPLPSPNIGALLFEKALNMLSRIAGNRSFCRRLA